MNLLCVLAVLNSSALASTELVQWPTDVSAQTRGAQAVGFDPAASGRAEGFEIQLRQRARPNGSALGALGLFSTVPWDGGAVYGGFEWGDVPRPASSRLTLGTAFALTPEVYLGVSYRSFWPVGQVNYVGVWDLGLFIEAASWISISVGLDAFNAPDGPANGHQPRALRVGVAIRPIVGKPWLTLAADTRLVGGLDARWVFPDTRTWVDVSPWEGVHLGVAYERTLNDNLLWGMLGVDIFGANLQGMGRIDNGVQDTGIALTVRARPQESIVRPVDQTVDVPLEGDLLGNASDGGGPFKPSKTISTTVLKLDALAENAAVDTVVLPMGPLKVGMGTVDELRAAIGKLRASGKHVVAELRGADDKTYMVAAAADKIRLDPLATLIIDGFSVTHHFYAAALAKVGVRFDAVGVGKYKSGPDPLTRDTARPEDKEVEGEILSLAHATLQQSLEKDRRLDPGQVAKVFEAGLFSASAAMAAGLADELTSPEDPNLLPPRRVPNRTLADLDLPSRTWSTPPVVAVVPVVGTIVSLKGDNPLPGASADAKTIVAQLQAAEDDPRVAGVVLRIDSPGGDVYASELIWRAVRRLAERKPVVASMADVAASGGYYIAAPAHAILAQANTVTGSIGIFMVKPDIHGTLEWLGVHGETYKSAERADWESIEKPLSDADKERVKRNMEGLYGAFIGRVSAGRHLPEERVRELAEGRVYTGRRAKELGLVDTLGGLADAIRLVRERAGLPVAADVQVHVPDREFNLQGMLGSMVSVQERPLDAVLTDMSRRLNFWNDRPLAMMPYDYALDGEVAP